MAAPKASEARKRIMEGEPAKAPRPPVYFTTGHMMLDLVLGGGRGKMGLKGGVLARFVAVNSGGKSSLATEMLAHNIRKPPSDKFWHQYLDREYRFSFDTKSTYGVEIDVRGVGECPRTVEELSAHLGLAFKEHRDPGIMVIDSLEAFSTEETEDRADERESLYSKDKEVVLKGSYTVKMGAAASYSETLRVNLADAAETGTLIIALSQIRQNSDAGPYGPKHKKVGGAALDHWVDTEVWLKPLHYITVGSKADQTERTIGFVGKAWEEKGTKDRPYRECLYTILYGYGVDSIGDSLDFLYNLRDASSGKFWNLERKGNTANGECPFLIAWKEGAEKTPETVMEWLRESGKLDEAKEARKQEAGHTRMSLEWMDGWIAKDPELQAAYVERFPVYTRDQLIRAIEADKDMEAELARRTVEKWEAVESMAASNRRSKFA